jgi:cholesterol transport system auxiliary component
MTGWRLAGVAILVLVAACSIGRPVPQPTTYAITLSRPAGTSSVPRRQQSLRVGNVRVAAAYAGSALVYRTSSVRMIPDPYNQLITEPGAMLGDQMAAWLERSGPFRSVAHPNSTGPTDYVLEAIVTELYGDFQPRRTPAAVVTMQLTLIDQTGIRPRAVFEREIERRVDLPQASPEALVGGFSEALAQILTELASELQAVRTE